MSPTIAENGDYLPSSFSSENQDWTDSLAECPFSAVGCLTNQVYRGGTGKEERKCEDRSLHKCLDKNVFLYAIFDGEFGSGAADYASQKIPATFMFDTQFTGQETDEEVKGFLRQAFMDTEATFFECLGKSLAEKVNIKELILKDLSSSEALQNHPEAVNRLSSINAEVESATSAVVALIYKNKLYVASVGNCRALLVKTDELNEIEIDQLTVSHDFENDDELLRLNQLGLNTEELRKQAGQLRYSCTRCIGNYTVKRGYKEYGNYSEATSEPVIAEPEIVGGIPIDDSFRFLLLMSDGLYKSLEQARGEDEVNSRIANLTMEQFSEQISLNGVAQTVVNKIAQLHHDTYLQKDNKFSKNCLKRDDITLLVRNFNQRLENKQDQNTILKKTISQSNGTINENNTSRNNGSRDNIASTVNMNQAASIVVNAGFDQDAPIEPYVDFSDFYKAIGEAYEKGEVPESWLQPSDLGAKYNRI